MATFVIRASVLYLAYAMADLCFSCMRPRAFCRCPR